MLNGSIRVSRMAKIRTAMEMTGNPPTNHSPVQHSGPVTGLKHADRDDRRNGVHRAILMCRSLSGRTSGHSRHEKEGRRATVVWLNRYGGRVERARGGGLGA